MIEYVQALIAARAGSHEEVVVAAARASVRAYVNDPEQPGWEPWITGRFVKSVRRARPAEFLRVSEQAIVVEAVGEARVAGFAPLPMEEWWEPLRKLQVGNFERERTGVWPGQAGGPKLIINPELGMSTGKTAAQVAHGLFAYAIRLGDGPRQAWVEGGMDFTVETGGVDFMAWALKADLVIEDAGRTEIDPGSITVLVI